MFRKHYEYVLKIDEKHIFIRKIFEIHNLYKYDIRNI